FGVGEGMKVQAFVDEALAVRVDQQAEDVAVLLELIAHALVAELGRVEVPAGGVAARPVAAWLSADRERHAQAVAHVEAGAAHLGELPAGPEIARAPFGVGLEAAAGEHHGAGGKLGALAVPLG